jgi:hypothetical protein
MRWRADLFGDAADWTRRLSLATALGVFFGLVGPFNTYASAPPAERMVFWTGMLWAGAILMGLTVGPAARLGGRLGFGRIFCALLATVIASLPLAFLVAFAARSLWPGSRGLKPLDWYGQTLTVSVPLMLVHLLWIRSRAAADAPSASAAETPTPQPGTFLRRLPPALGRELLCLQMEDHYVRAHTPAGSALVLIPLRDAIVELGDLPGLQVHRSWWVARNAVERAVKDGRNLKLRLVNGLEVPIARTGVAAARAAGWLD